ncbi:hypothetical protein H0H81_005281 [Sphagnurus paluster]|uniref:Uncharacterized protein n=1 Tax=Sphagnurus paluster TaxID=117069 RepID=A0A9P7FY64_9AGAR|nr:hypothetical protein H0H81_005281 [Sphagnurus paluster]
MSIRQKSDPKVTFQIEYLESQIQAYKARISVLQQQKISALDTLDDLVQQHKQDLDQESTARQLLEHKLYKNREMLRAVERERDELRDAVLELIQKVEKSQNDFKSWPCSKLQLSSYTDPVGAHHTQPDHHHELQENLTYAEGIIRSLKDELQHERQAHALTRVRIRTLEAQVASRDAALEALTQEISPTTVRNENGQRKARPESQRDLDHAEISSLFIQTVKNNRTLEQEIRCLFENLERARLKTEAPLGPSTSSSTPLHRQPIGRPHPKSPHRGRSRERKASHAVSPQRHSCTPSLRHQTDNPPLLPAHVITESSTAPPIARRAPSTSEAYSPRLGTRNEASNHIPNTSKARPPVLSGAGRPRPSPRATSTRQPESRARPDEHHAAPSSSNILQHLDDQIRLLSAQIDAFHAERAALVDVIKSQLHDSSEVPRSNHVTSDLQASPNMGSRQSESVRAEDLDTEGGERSMELETPLFPALMTFPMLDTAPAPGVSQTPAPTVPRPKSRANRLSPDVTHAPEVVIPPSILQLLPDRVSTENENEILMIPPRVGLSSSPPPPPP